MTYDDYRRQMLQYLVDKIDEAAAQHAIAECAAEIDVLFLDLYAKPTAADAVAKLHAPSDGRPVRYQPLAD